MIDNSSFHEPMQEYAASVKTKMTQITHGEPEDQLRTPFENFLAHISPILGVKVVCTGETPLLDRLGKPDYAVHVNNLLAGYVELKAPGTGAVARRFKGHNRKQFKRFSAIPNLLYTDGNEWALYRTGELVGDVVQLSGDIVTDGRNAAALQDANALEPLLRDFFSWKPIIPTDSKGKIDLRAFAGIVAPLTRMLRNEVIDALNEPESTLVQQLAKDWRQLLFPDAPDEQFADAYAQTVTFALLLSRSEGAEPLTFNNAETTLAAQHNLLSRALQILTEPSTRTEMSTSLDMLLRIIAAVPPATFTGPEDPWLYFYEDFLAVYDPKLRKDAGAYYTPIEVVNCQVRLIDELLVNRLGKPLGFSDQGVITLDPATGTGTYLLGVIKHTLDRIKTEQGVGAVAGQANELAKNLYGFELMVGPYAVTELRVSRALRDHGAVLPTEGTHIYLTDTLESPHAEPPQLPLFLQPIAEQHAKALEVKSNVPVIICLGNPPYDRHEAVTEDNKARTGGWVRWGDSDDGDDSIFRDFLDPVIYAGHGVHIKNIYNLYVYFWRWALWKVFEHPASHGPGIVSFISASSYLDGEAFSGMREHMRRLCDDIWILDIGGEGRGTHKDDNIFAIQTPVAIAIAVRSEEVNQEIPACIHYIRIEGNREAKLAELDTIQEIANLKWQECPNEWQASFRPSGKGNYFNWPLLTDLMPWQQSGCKVSRKWPIGSSVDILVHRWSVLLSASDTDRSDLFHESRDRKINRTYSDLLNPDYQLRSIISLDRNERIIQPVRYAYRSFDRQWIIPDNRVGDVFSVRLWRTHSDHQVYLTSLLTKRLGTGPALMACAAVPDLDHFSNRGAKDTIPLYRTTDSSVANILPNLLELLGDAIKHKVSPEDFLAYIYGILAQPAFTERFHKELETRELRIPITKNAKLFKKVCDIGAQLLWLHTYGVRFVPKNIRPGQIPPGTAKCLKALPGDKDGYPEDYYYDASTLTLHIGEGEFAPIAREVYEFEVSGLKVVQSWVGYRMKEPKGRRSSQLDDINVDHWPAHFTTELLELLWILERTVAGYSEQAELLEDVLDSECFLETELPEVPDALRKPPKYSKKSGDLF